MKISVFKASLLASRSHETFVKQNGWLFAGGEGIVESVCAPLYFFKVPQLGSSRRVSTQIPIWRKTKLLPGENFQGLGIELESCNKNGNISDDFGSSRSPVIQKSFHTQSAAPIAARVSYRTTFPLYWSKRCGRFSLVAPSLFRRCFAVVAVVCGLPASGTNCATLLRLALSIAFTSCSCCAHALCVSLSNHHH